MTRSSRNVIISSDSLLISALQRLYDEAINTCLDIWDNLLSSQIYAAINVTKGFDKKILTEDF